MMSVYITVDSASEFRDQFVRMNRGSQFSYDALGALYEALEQWSEDLGKPIECDVIELCTTWMEYSDVVSYATLNPHRAEMVRDILLEHADESDIEFPLEILWDEMSTDKLKAATTDILGQLMLEGNGLVSLPDGLGFLIQEA